MNRNHLVALSDLAADLRVGHQLRQAIVSEDGGETALVSLGNVRDGVVSLDNLPSMSLGDVRPQFFLQKEDVLLRSRGASYGAAVVPFVPTSTVALAPLYILRLKQSVLPDYLVWYLNRPVTQAILKSFEAGTSIRSVSLQAFGDLEVLVPPLEVQAQIAEVARLQREERELTETLLLRREKQTQALLEKLLGETA